jgi:predicted DNA-binding transcriptional regulator YafY
MSIRESISRCNLIIKKLRNKPATFSEINDYLSLESELQGYNFVISKRTFQRDLQDIRSIYNIDIQYDYSQKVYFFEMEQQPVVSERILEAFDIFNALNISDRLSEFINFENRKPLGTENILGILHSIKKRFQIKFTYHKYCDEETSERVVEPLALKEFKNRWYVIANDLKDYTIKSFALDRLTALEITNKKFIENNSFNVNEHFKHCFGIIGPNENKPQEIVLSFHPIQGKYIKSLPLHYSQQIILDSENELRIKLKLVITFDFFMELLSFGEYLKVIKPSSLINDIKTSLINSLKQY